MIWLEAFQLENALLSKEYFRETLLIWWFMSESIVEHSVL